MGGQRHIMKTNFFPHRAFLQTYDTKIGKIFAEASIEDTLEREAAKSFPRFVALVTR